MYSEKDLFTKRIYIGFLFYVKNLYLIFILFKIPLDQ